MNEQEISQERIEYTETRLAAELDNFRKKMQEVSEEVMSNVYTDVLPHIASDTEYNISNRVEHCVKNLIAGRFEDISTDGLKPYLKVADGYGMHCYIHLSQYSNMIKPIWDMFKGEIESVRIKQLEDQVNALQEEAKAFYRNRY